MLVMRPARVALIRCININQGGASTGGAYVLRLCGTPRDIRKYILTFIRASPFGQGGRGNIEVAPLTNTVFIRAK